jgi:hypothetical protein
VRRALFVATLSLASVAVATPLWGQASLYGVLGVGLPGQAVSVRSRALGWGLAAFDAGSAVNPAAVGLLGRLSVAATATTSFRKFSAGETTAEGLRQTRFLYGMVGGRVARSPFSFAISFAPYLDRTSDIASTDTITLRGNPVEVQDRVVADGGVSDLRGAIGWRVASRLQVGAAAHVLSGSTRLRTIRRFSDSAFVSLRDSNQASFSGFGMSVGASLNLSRHASIAVSFRSDTRLDRSIDSVEVGSVDLPVTVVGGIALAPLRALRWSSTVTWRNWSDVEVEGTRSFDTWEVGAGLEIGGPDIGASRIPLRLGVRFAQLPFSPTDDQPTEWVASGGTAYPFARNRAVIEATVERVFRDGGGANERVWQLSFGLVLIP